MPSITFTESRYRTSGSFRSFNQSFSRF